MTAVVVLSFLLLASPEIHSWLTIERLWPYCQRSGFMFKSVRVFLILALVLLVLFLDDRTSKGVSATECPFSDIITYRIRVK